MIEGIIGTCYSMAHGQIALVNFVVVAAFARFVAEKVNLVVALDVPQTVRLVPAVRKYIERNLTACNS